jgi:3-hydroxyacyl-[acyl-carrier-protein] dehydratase
MTFPLPETLLPHRHPQLFVTRILRVDAEPRILAEFDATPELFPGHFPGRVIVPGVAYVESLAQALACLAALTGDPGPHVLTGVDRAKFKGICTPPATLTLEIAVTERRFGLTWAKGTVRLGTQLLCQATLQAASMPAELAAQVLPA